MSAARGRKKGQSTSHSYDNYQVNIKREGGSAWFFFSTCTKKWNFGRLLAAEAFLCTDSQSFFTLKLYGQVL